MARTPADSAGFVVTRIARDNNERKFLAQRTDIVVVFVGIGIEKNWVGFLCVFVSARFETVLFLLCEDVFKIAKTKTAETRKPKTFVHSAV